ncbi:FkbM family methyltransferase [Streptomyces marincola]|uniref:FkbM family methyltransferase n=1 Tax=Streptomyces marincola TaxID=2878388 RepID=UPI00131CFD28|nr:FkbM family methyltransferase [Streptomyces marincola]
MDGLLLIELAGQLNLWVPNEAEGEAHWQHEEIFNLGCYDDIRLPENALVFDVGANVGLFSLFVRSRYPKAEIHAFEPMPEVAKALRKNAELHDLADFHVTQCALGAHREEDVEFTYYPAIPGNSTRYPEDKELQIAVLSRDYPPDEVAHDHTGRPVRATVERLSSFLAAGRTVDLLKVDVEGAELDVLRGIDDEHWGLVQQTILEVQDLDNQLKDVVGMLESRGMTTRVQPSPLIPPDIRTYMVSGTRAAG